MSADAVRKEIERADYELNVDAHNRSTEQRAALAQVHATLAVAEVIVALIDAVNNVAATYAEVHL